ncbi:MAG: peptide chain release factor N(5)-glutamine methyltransferase [Lachnospiraceae bacterium]|nr:peptide chain release factor N(5)-glutamine methyltransferase [Ruminococcus sp.]MCM1275720.1 peptide chain release factor N(5)-glutamine methyltransferase [Lachnospiraceae bacterium]
MTIRELLQATAKRLSEGGVENARFEAEQLLEKAGLPKLKLLTEPLDSVPEETERAAWEFLEKRLSGYPLQYILGDWEFFGLPFAVGEGVLIPRQDTETLAETARDFLLARVPEARRAADLCAGSGCIGIALARLCNAEVTCVELSESAFGYLERNIALNGVTERVHAVRGDVLDGELDLGEFDLIVSNPPYLDDTDMLELQTEVSFEPKAALYGGADGLDFYRGILPIWTKRLKRGGMLAVEIGLGQERGAAEIFAENGIKADKIKDARGIYRVVYGVKN